MSAQIETNPPIGRIKGPGTDPHTFTFIAPDTKQRLKIGEFVTYDTLVEASKQAIYGRVQRRRAIRLLPDDFSLDPNIAPELLAEILGYHENGYPLFEITVGIIGYYDTDMGGFINPRIDPISGSPLYLATNEALTDVLNYRELTEPGAVHIGSLLSRPDGSVPVVLDAADFTSTHLSIIASTGAGKSYLTAVVIEELLKPQTRAAVLIIDPHSEYGTLAELPDHPAYTTSDYRPTVKVFTPGKFKIPVSNLFVSDLIHLLPDLSERMIYLLERAFREVQSQQKRQRQGNRWTINDLIAGIKKIGSGDESDDGLKGYSRTADALAWRLESVLNQTNVFDDTANVSFQDLYQPGQATVLQLSEMDKKEQQVLVAALLRRLLWARIQTEKGGFHPGHNLYLPYPVFVILEEAHRFAPMSMDVVSSPVLKEVLGEGRKFGVGMGIISQRPGKLDGDVLSQCNTHCLLRIVNDLDQRKVAESIEVVGRDLLTELPALTKGQVIVAGTAVSTPILCQVRNRYTSHGAESKNAPKEWRKQFLDKR